MGPPRISIAMATYNGERFIEEQLASLAAQTSLPFEVQVGDDGSTDATEELVRHFAEQAPFPVTWTRNDEQLGYGENFLRTASRCSGDWIAFCDQDDVWAPDKLAQCAKAIQDGPADLMLVAHHAWLGDEHAHSTGRRVYSLPVGTFPSLTLPGAWFCAGFMQVFKADLVRELPLWPRAESPRPPEPDKPPLVRHSHDTWIPLLANVLGSIRVLPAELASYRRYGGNLSDFAHLTARARSQAALMNHAQEYARLGDWYSETATLLDTVAQSAPNMAGKLAAGASLFQREADALHLRSRLHSGRTIGNRLASLAALIRNGAYSRRWTLRRRSLWKDLARVVAPLPAN